jgi:Fe-S-cluster containining protein
MNDSHPESGDARRDAALGAAASFHEMVDHAAAAVAAQHGPRLTCHRGCAACCIDGVTVFSVEAGLIRRSAEAAALRGAPAAPEGRCAFLDASGACRVYAARPYVCRTQGLPLRWLEERDDGSADELRDICELNEAGPPIEELAPDACWTIGSFEERLAAIEEAFTGGRPRRVSLRALFAEIASLQDEGESLRERADR